MASELWRDIAPVDDNVGRSFQSGGSIEPPVFYAGRDAPPAAIICSAPAPRWSATRAAGCAAAAKCRSHFPIVCFCSGALAYRKGDNLYAKRLNMIFVFEKVTPGRHAGPEDVGKLMVECNGPLAGAMGAKGMEKALSVFPRK